VAEAVRRSAAHARRFGLAYFLLAIVVGAALGTTIVLLSREGHESSAWSGWRPAAPSELRTKEIAAHVAAAYRLENGRPLVSVVTGDPFESVVTQVATPAIGAGIGDATRFYDASHTRMFVLCGSGQNCSLPGTGTAARAQLLRREALELALYTLKYVDAESVVEFLPGRTKTRPELAFFFRRHELSPFLSEPLGSTLALKTPPLLPADVDPAEARRVDQLTLTHMFRFQLQPSQTGGGLLVLDRG
jgi:hypothetical protein